MKIWEDKECERRASTLLSKMTLSEKAGQMVYLDCGRDCHEDAIRSGRVGTIANVHGASGTNRLQKIAVEESRLGIPLLCGNDVIQGYRTIFPIPLAQACSWDTAMIERNAAIAAVEASAAGTRWIYTPMLDVARDPRWGRIAEGAGEDTFLTCAAGRAQVRGFKRASATSGRRVISCAKHFVGYGACEGGRDYNTADISENVLRNVYLPPFRACVAEGVETVMTSFNEVFGLPVAASRFLLQEILRNELGFDGLIVTDYNAVFEFLAHGVAESPEQACKLAIDVGVDMDMNSGLFTDHLASLVESGQVPMKSVDRSVHRVLCLKYWLGLFDGPYVPEEGESAVMICPGHRLAALESAARSMVLLKNDGDLLPLRKDLGKIAVLGPLADDRDAPLGWWRCRGDPGDVVSVLGGIQSKLGAMCEVMHARGCSTEGDEEEGFSEAVELARRADAIVVVLGESARMSGEAHSRSTLGLPGRQEALLKVVCSAGRPVVVVLINGRPLATPWIYENVPAVLEAWQPGIQCGAAVADLLFGDCCPTGKLVVTIARGVGQLPVYYNHKTTGRPPVDTGASRYVCVSSAPVYPDADTARYLDLPPTPQYPFGFGLGYTQFEYRDIRLSAECIRADETVLVSARVRNAGARAGEEVVQLYIQDVVGSITRPVKELRGFKRISLAPSEETAVGFPLGSDELGFYDAQNKFVVEPGTFRVWIGPDSAHGLEAAFTVVK